MLLFAFPSRDTERPALSLSVLHTSFARYFFWYVVVKVRTTLRVVSRSGHNLAVISTGSSPIRH